MWGCRWAIFGEMMTDRTCCERALATHQNHTGDKLYVSTILLLVRKYMRKEEIEQAGFGSDVYLFSP